MTVKFTKQNTNYNHQNIIDLLSNINDPVIKKALNDGKHGLQIIQKIIFGYV